MKPENNRNTFLTYRAFISQCKRNESMGDYNYKVSIGTFDLLIGEVEIFACLIAEFSPHHYSQGLDRSSYSVDKKINYYVDGKGFINLDINDVDITRSRNEKSYIHDTNEILKACIKNQVGKYCLYRKLATDNKFGDWEVPHIGNILKSSVYGDIYAAFDKQNNFPNVISEISVDGSGYYLCEIVRIYIKDDGTLLGVINPVLKTMQSFYLYLMNDTAGKVLWYHKDFHTADYERKKNNAKLAVRAVPINTFFKNPAQYYNTIQDIIDDGGEKFIMPYHELNSKHRQVAVKPLRGMLYARRNKCNIDFFVDDKETPVLSVKDSKQNYENAANTIIANLSYYSSIMYRYIVFDKNMPADDLNIHIGKTYCEIKLVDKKAKVKRYTIYRIIGVDKNSITIIPIKRKIHRIIFDYYLRYLPNSYILNTKIGDLELLDDIKRARINAMLKKFPAKLFFDCFYRIKVDPYLGDFNSLCEDMLDYYQTLTEIEMLKKEAIRNNTVSRRIKWLGIDDYHELVIERYKKLTYRGEIDSNNNASFLDKLETTEKYYKKIRTKYSLKFCEWIEEDQLLILREYPFMKTSCVNKLSRYKPKGSKDKICLAIKNIAAELGMNYEKDFWSPEEDTVLKEYYLVEGKRVVHRLYKRNFKACTERARELGII